jgi:hypothetical protein
VYVCDADGRLHFAEIDPPTHDELHAIVQRLSRRITRIIDQRITAELVRKVSSSRFLQAPWAAD